jgi:hypothetical protein
LNGAIKDILDTQATVVALTLTFEFLFALVIPSQRHLGTLNILPLFAL